jgi:hypothetical protein
MHSSVLSDFVRMVILDVISGIAGDFTQLRPCHTTLHSSYLHIITASLRHISTHRIRSHDIPIIFKTMIIHHQWRETLPVTWQPYPTASLAHHTSPIISLLIRGVRLPVMHFLLGMCHTYSDDISTRIGEVLLRGCRRLQRKSCEDVETTDEGPRDMEAGLGLSA